MMQGVVIADAVGQVRYANPAAHQLLGWGSPQPAEALFLESLPFAAPLRDRLKVDSGPWEEETALKTRGAEVPVRVAVRAFEQDGAFAGTALLITDLTAPPVAIAERDQARNNNRAKTRALYMVAHDLSGPITVLNGYISLVQDGSLAIQQLERYIPILAAQLDHMQRLIEVLLDTARLEEGRLELALQPVDLGDLVTEIVAELGRSEKLHKLVLQRRTPHLPVLADPVRLDSIARNMISNAIKYSPEATTVTCTVTSIGTSAVLEVADEGPGIRPADLERLFTRFGRVGATASNRAGVGLGLFLSRELARLHGGDLSAASEVGKGSRFRLRLPLRTTKADT